MNTHLDFTIDFETTALTTNAAVMQVAIVPWLRDAENSPFITELYPFIGRVDLRTCVIDGFDFDPATIKWWYERSDAAKQAVACGTPRRIEEILHDALNYMKGRGLESACLWSQGSDFDLAILRNLCQKYDVDLDSYIPHTSFRDCRTIILETAMAFCNKVQPAEDDVKITAADIMRRPSLAYDLYEPLPEQYANGGEAHDALYDAMRSSWNTWQALNWLRGKE